MRTTIDLPDHLFKEVKARAVYQGMKLKDLLATYIEMGLRGVVVQPASASAGKRPPLPVAIPRITGTPLHPAMTNEELYALMDA